MKRIFFLIIALAVVGTVAWLSADVTQSIHTRQTVAQRIQALPRLSVAGIAGESIDLSASPRIGTVIVYFTTACPFCREEIEDFVANSTLFKRVRVVLLSAEDVGVLQRYATNLQLERTDFIVGFDADRAAARYFEIRKVPATFVYDWAGRLVHRFDGMVSAATVAAALSDSAEEFRASEMANDG